MMQKFQNLWRYCDLELWALLFVAAFMISVAIFASWWAESLERSRKSSDQISGQIVSINNTNFMIMREGVLYKLLPVKTNSVQ